MYDYIKGTVTCLKNNAIVLDNNGVGFLIYVSNPYSFEVGKDYKVFVYQQIREDENCLYGFKTIEELELLIISSLLTNICHCANDIFKLPVVPATYLE